MTLYACYARSLHSRRIQLCDDITGTTKKYSIEFNRFVSILSYRSQALAITLHAPKPREVHKASLHNVSNRSNIVVVVVVVVVVVRRVKRLLFLLNHFADNSHADIVERHLDTVCAEPHASHRVRLSVSQQSVTKQL